MAFGLKRWLGLVFLLALGVALLGLPPRPTRVPARHAVPEGREWSRLKEELLQEGWLYQRIQWRDSLTRNLRDRVSEGDRLVLGLPEQAPDSLMDRLERAVRLELDHMGLEEPVIPVGVFVLPMTQGRHPGILGLLAYYRTSDEFYVARGGEAPFCIIGAPFNDTSPHADSVPSYTGSWLLNRLGSRVRSLANIPGHSLSVPNTLKLCRYYARYGQAGPEITDWLRRGASGFGSRVYTFDHTRQFSRGPARRSFGRVGPFSSNDPVGFGCLAGVREACEKMTMPQGAETGVFYYGSPELDYDAFLTESPVDFLENYPSNHHHLFGYEDYIFFALEEEFGPQRFGRFWTSDLPPAQAFESAFGEPFDLWMMGWARKYFDPLDRGPRLPVQATLLTFLSLGILAGGAIFMGRGRIGT
ncbi:hypothetical protein ACFL0I_04040 [Gemmatimonadota bacterium]